MLHRLTVIAALALAIAPVASHAQMADTVRMHYSSKEGSLPEHILLMSLAQTMKRMGPLQAEGIVLGMLNQINYENGVIGFIESEDDWIHSREVGVLLTARLQETVDLVQQQHLEIIRVVACPLDRLRPSGNDAWTAMQAAGDLEDMLWEEHRLRLRQEFGDAFTTLISNYQPGYTSFRHHLAKVHEKHSTPDQKLGEYCHAHGF